MRAVILISGRGSNMEALLKADLPLEFVSVISNRPGAAGLVMAKVLGVPTDVVDHQTFPDRASFDAAMIEKIDQYTPDLVLLAGFMRVLTADFVRHYENRLINIHPALLPAFPGLHTHERALAAGVKVHGCTVHFVTPEVDVGPIIMQAVVPVMADDSADTLAARVLEQEHRIFPLAVRWYAEGKLGLDNGRVRVRSEGTFQGALISPAFE